MLPRRKGVLRRHRFSHGERETAEIKNEMLKKARTEFQLLADEMITGKISKGNAGVFRALLEKNHVKESLLQLVTDSLFLSENLREAAKGKGPMHNISPIDEGALFAKIRAARNTIKQAREMGILPTGNEQNRP